MTARVGQPPDQDVARRLVEARVKRGFPVAKKAADFFNWNYSTYSQHERGERNIRKEVADRYSRAYKVSTAWLLTGEGTSGPPKAKSVGRIIEIEEDRLRAAIEFALRNEGVPEERAELVADILPEALLGDLVDAVDRDPFLSFRVHFQLGVQRSERPKQQ